MRGVVVLVELVDRQDDQDGQICVALIVDFDRILLGEVEDLLMDVRDDLVVFVDNLIVPGKEVSFDVPAGVFEIEL